MLYPIKDLFFRRMERLKGDVPDYYSYELDDKIRHKIIGTIMDYKLNRSQVYSVRMIGRDYEMKDELENLNAHVERELGRNISQKRGASQRISNFMFNCSDEEFLSTIEILVSLKFNNYQEIKRRAAYPLSEDVDVFRDNLKSFVNAVNEVFRIDKFGYEIVPVSLPKLPYIIVPFNSKYLYVETIREPLSLMHNAKFKGPLNEFEKALDDYRNEKYGDSIHKANKAYESTLKTILELKKIEFNPAKEKIPQLVQKIQDETDIIDSSLRDLVNPFMSVLKKGQNIIRNMEGIGHGQGMNVKEMEKSYADFILRLTGTYIVFIIERYNETK